VKETLDLRKLGQNHPLEAVVGRFFLESFISIS
jgi:hypothetical protein